MKETKRLIVFAGPSCVGKTTIINRMMTGDYKQLTQRLEIDNILQWNSIEAIQWYKHADKLGSKIILHYDILRPHIKYTNGAYADDNSLNGINSYKNITMITLWATTDILLRRLNNRKIALENQQVPIVNLPIKWSRKRRFKKVSNLYKNPTQVINHYNQWMQFTKTLKLKTHWILDTTIDQLQCLPATHWSMLQNKNTKKCNKKVCSPCCKLTPRADINCESV